jgi:hypothetical protein
MKKLLLLSSLIAFVVGCAKPPFRMFYKPVIFDDQRKQLSIDYLQTRHGIKRENPIIKPVMVVLHWTAMPSLEKTFDAFNHPTYLNPGKPFLRQDY